MLLWVNGLLVDIANMMYDVSENLVDTYHSDGDFENFKLELLRSFSMDSPVEEKEFLQICCKRSY